MTGRNSPCDCGSGKKFKYCHGSLAGSGGNETRNQLQAATRLFQQGRKNEAYDLAMASPNSIERSKLLITILIGRRQPVDIEKALKLITKWKRSAPASPEPWARQIEIHIFRNQLSLAQRAFDELKRRAPRHARTLYYKGLLLQLSGQLKKAHMAYRESTQIRHGTVPGKLQPGEKGANALAAITVYETAIGNHPGTRTKNIMRLLDQPAVLELLQTSLEQWENEIQATGKTISGKEADSLAKAWYQLGCVYMGTDESVRCFHKALKWNENHEKARQDALFVLNYNTRLTTREIFQEHLNSGRELQRRYPCKGLVFQNDRDQTRALRIAYLSSDFRQHPVVKFILPVLEFHDPERVMIFLYHDHKKEDEYTNKARQFALKFRQVKDLKNDDLVNQIIADRIDILVDLNGHTGSGRMPVFSRRAAPVQISWIGYPNTTGLDNVDYRIVDEVTDPWRHCRPLYRHHA
jgi:tetratricopeptide (TPR) repeat protein